MRKHIGNVLLAVVMALPARAGDLSRQIISVTDTKTLDGASVKTLRLEGSRGDVSVEGWDKPQVEVTVIKSTNGLFDPRQHAEATRLLEGIKIASEPVQDAIAITTSIPEHDRKLVHIGYVVKAPRGTSVEVSHHSEGDVSLIGMSGDIEVTTRHGQITIDTPAEARYSIDAHMQYGEVYSDFEGQDRRHRLFHHDFTSGDGAGNSAGAQSKMLLRAEVGDIVILKAHTLHPEASASAR